MPKRVDPTCAAYQRAIGLLARPWTGQILALLQAGPLRFGELQERALGVSAKVLSARLKQLCNEGVIERRVEELPPVRVSYALTRKGRAFGEVSNAIERWGRALVSKAPNHVADRAARRAHRKER